MEKCFLGKAGDPLNSVPWPLFDPDAPAENHYPTSKLILVVPCKALWVTYIMKKQALYKYISLTPLVVIRMSQYTRLCFTTSKKKAVIHIVSFRQISETEELMMTLSAQKQKWNLSCCFLLEFKIVVFTQASGKQYLCDVKSQIGQSQQCHDPIR